VAIKRWDKLLTMAAELKWRGLDFDVQIVGSGPLRDQLDEKVRRLQISDRIVFRGHIDDIPSVLSSASLLVHTADAEGTPNAVMEAMSCGRAVVATDVGDVRFLVEDGKSGFVVDREDDAMLSERVATLLTDGELCRRMGEAGRVKAEREFGLDRLVCNTLNAYRSAGWKDSFEPPAESTGMDRNACLSRQTD
jgi:glycosyltransferase involved in cell wall biosynthesis